MPKLPSVGDFSRPSPAPNTGIVRPRVVKPTAGQIEARSLTNLGVDVAQGGIVLAQAQERIQNRKDVIERARLMQQYDQYAQDTFFQKAETGDLADPKTIDEYRSALEQKQQEIMGMHSGSPNSKAILMANMETAKGRSLIRAASLSHQAQLNQLDSVMADELSQLKQSAMSDPQNWGKYVGEWGNKVSENKDLLPQEGSTNLNGASAIANAAINSLILNNEYAAANSILDSFPNMIGADKVRENILQAQHARRTAQEQFTQTMDAKVNWLKLQGVPVTQDVKLALMGLNKNGQESLFGSSVTGHSLDYLTRLAPAVKYSQEKPGELSIFLAAATEYTQPRTIVDPTTQEVRTIYPELPPAASEALAVRGIKLPTRAPAVSPAPKKGEVAKGPEPTAWDLAIETAGPVPAIAEKVGSAPFVGGLTGGGGSYTVARNKLPIWQRDLVTVLQNNPRYAVGEMEQIRKEISIESSVWDNPEHLRNRYIAINDALEARAMKAEEAINDPSIGADMRRQAGNVLLGIKQFQKHLGVPPRVWTEEQRNELPIGTKYIGPDNQVHVKGGEGG